MVSDWKILSVWTYMCIQLRLIFSFLSLLQSIALYHLASYRSVTHIEDNVLASSYLP